MTVLRQVAVIVGVALGAAALTAWLHPQRPAWYRVTDPDLLRWQVSPSEAMRIDARSDVLWIDARSRQKYEQAHRPGAILLNAAEWGDLMYQHMDTLQRAMGNPVIVYCDGGDCRKSGNVAQRLRELLGLEPVYVLEGDWRELEPAGAGEKTP